MKLGYNIAQKELSHGSTRKEEINQNQIEVDGSDVYIDSDFKKNLDYQLVDVYSGLDGNSENVMYENDMHKSPNSKNIPFSPEKCSRLKESESSIKNNCITVKNNPPENDNISSNDVRLSRDGGMRQNGKVINKNKTGKNKQNGNHEDELDIDGHRYEGEEDADGDRSTYSTVQGKRNITPKHTENNNRSGMDRSKIPHTDTFIPNRHSAEHVHEYDKKYKYGSDSDTEYSEVQIHRSSTQRSDQSGPLDFLIPTSSSRKDKREERNRERGKGNDGREGEDKREEKGEGLGGRRRNGGSEPGVFASESPSTANDSHSFNTHVSPSKDKNIPKNIPKKIPQKSPRNIPLNIPQSSPRIADSQTHPYFVRTFSKESMGSTVRSRNPPSVMSDLDFSERSVSSCSHVRGTEGGQGRAQPVRTESPLLSGWRRESEMERERDRDRDRDRERELASTAGASSASTYFNGKT